MTVLQQLNSAPLFLICGGIIAFVALLCAVFAVRAWQAGRALGIDAQKMKRVVLSSASFSVLPSVGILLGVIALSGSLGIPWPWLRLSVIGALHYETQVAQGAAEQLGMQTLSAAEMTPQRFVTIALLMSFCIIWGMLLSVFFNKKYSKKLGLGSGGGAASFGDTAMTAMFIGLCSAYLGSYLGAFVSKNGIFTFSGSYVPIVVATVSGAVMALCLWLSKKPRMAWLDSFSVALSMLCGMASAVVCNLF